jgi:hypothetical protein
MKSTHPLPLPWLARALAGRGSLSVASALAPDGGCCCGGTGDKPFGGGLIYRNLALEAGCFRLGRFGLNPTPMPAGTRAGPFKGQGLNEIDVTASR